MTTRQVIVLITVVASLSSSACDNDGSPEMASCDVDATVDAEVDGALDAAVDVDGAVDAAVDADVDAAVDAAPTLTNTMLTFSSVTHESLLLEWHPASDDNTPTEQLEYRAFQSTEDLTTVAEIEARVTPLNAFTANLTSFQVDNVAPLDAPYYFYVIVRDGAGNKTLYAPGSITLPKAPMYLFPGGTAPGDFGGRGPADALCSATRAASFSALDCSNVRAFVGTGALGGQLKNFPDLFSVPSDRPIAGFTGISIANDWADLFDGSIANSLSQALELNDTYWTGSNASGDASNACYDTAVWTRSTGGSGVYGDHTGMGGNWLQAGNSACEVERTILCLCF